MFLINRYTTLLIMSLLACKPLAGHEFWIAPDYRLLASGQLEAQLKIGSDFDGSNRIYNPRQFQRFEIHGGASWQPVPGRMGDRPAVRLALPDSGRAVLVYQSQPEWVTWDEWSKFTGFLQEKGAADLISLHRQRGLAETGFSEKYIRYAKAVIAAPGQPLADRPAGLEFELLLLSVPPATEPGQIRFRLLWQGQPAASVRITCHARSGASWQRSQTGQLVAAARQIVLSDAKGEASCAGQPGTAYLIDAVRVAALSDADDPRASVWQSWWASLTFFLPPAGGWPG